MNIHLSLHERALDLVRRYKQVESELLECLQEIERKKIYIKFGYKSLFEYAVKALSLPEGTAYNFINISRKAKEIPELKLAIQNGEFTVSKARKISSVITPENKNYWISLAKELPQHALEREINKESKIPKGKKIRLALEVTSSLMQKITRAQDIESRKKRNKIGLEQLFETMADLYLITNEAKKAKKEQSEMRFQFAEEPKIPKKLKEEAYARDHGKCTFTLGNKKCLKDHWTEVYYIIPQSEGGKNELSNVQTLCTTHHQLLHRTLRREEKRADLQ